MAQTSSPDPHAPVNGSSALFWQCSLESLQAELGADGSGLDEAEAARRLARLRPERPATPPRAGARAAVPRPGSAIRWSSCCSRPRPSPRSPATSRASSSSRSWSCSASRWTSCRSTAPGGRPSDSSRSVALRATVVRSGRPVEIAGDQIVPGDVVLLKPGGLIPADGRVLEARDCFVNQALLTGEALSGREARRRDRRRGVRT